jgi:cell division cycle protein 37
VRGRWKQRDIHEKREIRKQKLHHLGLEKVMNATLLIRIRALIASTKTDGPLFIARTIGELRSKVPDYDGKVFAPGEQPSQDHMVLSLLTQVVNVVEKDNKGEEGRGDRLVAELNVHEGRLVKRQQEVDEETIVEEKEQRKFITSDDLHMGFESKTVRMHSAAVCASLTSDCR